MLSEIRTVWEWDNFGKYYENLKIDYSQCPKSERLLVRISDNILRGKSEIFIWILGIALT